MLSRFLLVATRLTFRVAFLKNLFYKCYVAAYDENEFINVARALHKQKCGIISNLLGESADGPGRAIHFVREYIAHIKNLASLKKSVPEIKLALSIKPSQIGLKFDEELAFRLARKLLQECLEGDIGFELDMEHPEHIDKTIALAKKLAPCAAGRGKIIRLAVQANQEKPAIKPFELTDPGLGVRIVKGAYPGSFSDHRTFSRFYALAISAGKKHKIDVAIGTHDTKLIRWVKSDVPEATVQMLFGVRPFAKKDWVYVAWGKKENAEKYFERRLKEGIRPNVFPLFALNFLAAILWRMLYIPKTFFRQKI